MDKLQPLIDEAKQYESAEQLLRSGGFSIEALDKAAFGFTEDEIKELDPKDLNIKWKSDFENARWQHVYEGLSKEEWAKNVDLSEPIDVVFENGKFYIDDGHHRYYAALILDKKLKVNLVIEDKPIAKITGKQNYDYDGFHRSFFASIHFASENEALQYLADLTGKRIKIAEEYKTIYRGDFASKAGNFWSFDPEFATQFTRTGQQKELKIRKIKSSDIYTIDKPPFAGDHDEVNELIKEATEKGFKAVELNEGRGEPNSIFVFDKSAIKGV